MLVISGGLGFVVLNDLFEFHKRRRLSLQSKLVLSVSGALIGIGALVVFIFEFTNGHTLASLTWPEDLCFYLPVSVYKIVWNKLD